MFGKPKLTIGSWFSKPQPKEETPIANSNIKQQLEKNFKLELDKPITIDSTVFQQDDTKSFFDQAPEIKEIGVVNVLDSGFILWVKRWIRNKEINQDSCYCGRFRYQWNSGI